MDTHERSEARAANKDAIADLAEQTHLPLADVAAVFEEQFAELQATARVTDYLLLFATRRARERLLSMHG